MLPVTTTMRVCDIWRGYWAQRLLWEIGGQLAFTGASVIQFRNVHTLMKDFAEEAVLYKDAGRLVNFLQTWAFNGSTLQEAIVLLSQDMARAGFWLQGDADLAGAWVEVCLITANAKAGKLSLRLLSWEVPSEADDNTGHFVRACV